MAAKRGEESEADKSKRPSGETHGGKGVRLSKQHRQEKLILAKINGQVVRRGSL